MFVAKYMPYNDKMYYSLNKSMKTNSYTTVVLAVLINDFKIYEKRVKLFLFYEFFYPFLLRNIQRNGNVAGFLLNLLSKFSVLKKI